MIGLTLRQSRRVLSNLTLSPHRAQGYEYLSIPSPALLPTDLYRTAAWYQELSGFFVRIVLFQGIYALRIEEIFGHLKNPGS